QRLPAYRNISRDLFPKLSAAKISVELEDTRFNNTEIAASVYALLQNGKPLEGFNQDHLVFAGQTAKRLDEKEAIFLKLTEIYPSELAFNNLGVVYLNQAQRELDTRDKNVLVTKSINMFRQANRIKTTSVSLHNIGRAYLLRGDYFDAYISISEASALEKNETDAFLIYNEGVRGALDIINGDYKLATIRLNRASENEENLFNKGLAYFLAEDYRMALESFEECVQKGRETGYGFYGLALVASYSEDVEALKENLSKAIDRSEFLRERALRDINFKPYFDKKEFIDIFR
uniref:tetratricopeptide repeat protein n=1 Tax=Aquiflexum sp. TaxID=1872584 RepID=UPI0035947F07